MKKYFLPIAVILMAVFSFTSCGSKAEKRDAPAGMMELDLGKYGKPFTMFVPDSTKGPVSVTEQNYMLEIRNGKTFGIVIEEGDGDINLVKTDLKEDDVNKFKSFITDEPTLLVWESEIAQPEFHFYAIVTVGNAKYVIKDIRSTDNEPFKNEDIKVMVESVKSILEKPKADA